MSNMTYYAEDLTFISAVTKALNELPPSSAFVLNIQLLERDTDEVVGEWSDEIAPDAWSYRETWKDEKA